MPTTTHRRRRPQPLTPMDITLDEFSAQIDAHLGRPVGYAEAVRDWRAQSNLIAALATKASYRITIHATLDRFIDSGNGVVAGEPLRRVTRGGGKRWALRSDAVRSRDEELWEAARVTSPVVVAEHHLQVPPMLSTPPMRTAAEVWSALDVAKKRASAARAARDAAREVVIATHEAVADTWDGSHRLTADGWKVGLNWRTTFSAAECARLAVDRGIDVEKLKVEVDAPLRTEYALGDARANEYDEFDGE